MVFTNAEAQFYGDTAYFTAASVANYLYAKNHGYDFLHVSTDQLIEVDGKPMLGTPGGPERDQSWIKIIALKYALNKFPNATYVVWLDTDAYFRDYVSGVPEMVAKAREMDPSANDAVLIGTEECPGVNLCVSGEEQLCRLNAGVYILQNLPGQKMDAKHFVSNLWSFPTEHDSFKRFLTDSYHEQTILNLIKLKDPDGKAFGKVVALPSNSMNCYEGRFIRHLVGMGVKNRILRVPLFLRSVELQLPSGLSAERILPYRMVNPHRMRHSILQELQKMPRQKVNWNSGHLTAQVRLFRFTCAGNNSKACDLGEPETQRAALHGEL
eukprot:g1040.t1